MGRSYSVMLSARSLVGIQGLGRFDGGQFLHRIVLECEDCGPPFLKEVVLTMDDTVVYGGKSYHAVCKCGCGRVGTLKIAVGEDQVGVFYSSADIIRGRGVRVGRIQAEGLQPRVELYSPDGFMSVIRDNGPRIDMEVEDIMEDDVVIGGLRFTLNMDR